MLRPLSLSFFLLSACASPAVLPPVSPEVAAEAWSFEKAAPAIRELSCAPSARNVPFEDITITPKPVPLGGDLAGLRYVGGWHLISEYPGFGGLSGLVITKDGDLLSVSDLGAFVLIDLEGGRPTRDAGFGYMRGADGLQLTGKLDSDAEGLAVREGIALVSFEREHRILAYDIENCGVAARGVEIAKLPGDISGREVDPNRGSEALSLSAAGELTFGYETGPGNGAPLGAVYGDGSARFTADASAPRGFAQVGRDELGEKLVELFRAYDPIRGNRNVIRIGELEVRLARPMTVDNFEGIALQEVEGGVLRVWIISDNNFNPQQRTLLMAFDIQ